MKKEYLVDIKRKGWTDWDFQLSFNSKIEATQYAKKLAKSLDEQVRIVELLDPENLSEPTTILVLN